MRNYCLAIFLVSAPLSAHAADTAALWSKKCASCHAEDGSAQTKVGDKHHIKDFRKPAWQASASDAKLRAIIADGVEGTKMPAFKDRLSADEINALVAYIRTLKRTE